MKYILLAFIAWNLITFLMYGIDKHFAMKRKRRISEFKLLLPPFIFASLGAAFGMIVFNHKTSKIKFRVLIPLAFIFNIVSVILIKYYIR